MDKEQNSADAIARIVASSATWAEAKQRVISTFGTEAVDLAGSFAVRMRGREWVRGRHDQIEVDATSGSAVKPSTIRQWLRAGRVGVYFFLAFLAIHCVVTLRDGVEDQRRLDEQCRPDGWLAHLEASLLGQRFWRDQARFFEAERRNLRELPVQIERVQVEARKSSQALLDKLYRENPELRPKATPGQAQAAALRAAADALERAEAQARLQALFAERDEALARCSTIAQQRSFHPRP